MKQPQPSTGAETTKIAALLSELVSVIPTSTEPASGNPGRARTIVRKSSLKAAALSGMLAVPPGPLGFATIIPDLLGIWRLQRQMVADIAGVYGCTAELKKEAMVYCLFKHGGAALTRDLIMRAGERLLIREASVKSMQLILRRIGMNLSERIIAKSISRFIPLAGAVGLGAYAYYDTNQVAMTAMELFSAPKKTEPPLLAEVG